MDAAGFRALADRCRELTRVAVRDDIRRQLRQWSEDFDAEADAAEKTQRFRRAREPVGAAHKSGRHT
jgi:hypothetical protein